MSFSAASFSAESFTIGEAEAEAEDNTASAIMQLKPWVEGKPTYARDLDDDFTSHLY